MPPSPEVKLHENWDLVRLARYRDASAQDGVSYPVGAQ